MVDLETVIKEKRQQENVPSEIMEKSELFKQLKSQIKYERVSIHVNTNTYLLFSQTHGILNFLQSNDKVTTEESILIKLKQKGELADQFNLLNQLIYERERIMLLVDFFEKVTALLF